MSEQDHYTKRKTNHDYYAPGQYHIILKKRPGFPDFGSVAGNPDIAQGLPGCAYIEKSLLGKIIGSHFFNLNRKWKFMTCHQYSVMPDHVHAYIQVLEETEKHLGAYIGGIKMSIAEEFSRKIGRKILPSEFFQDSYTDRIIYPGMDFKKIIKYVKLNPHKLAMKKKYPHFFERRVVFEYEGVEFEGYGNHFLLHNPFLMQVKFYSRKSFEENQEHKEISIERATDGWVLVSPFVHPMENDVRKISGQRGGRIIHIKHEPFRERFKPGDEDYNNFGEGRMLFIAPKQPIWDKQLNYATSSRMNELARKLATGEIYIPEL